MLYCVKCKNGSKLLIGKVEKVRGLSESKDGMKAYWDDFWAKDNMKQECRVLYYSIQ